jgi:hypothetical protein
MSDNAHSDVVREVGIFGLKALITLNSGGSLVVLSFLGSVIGAEENILSVNVPAFKWSIGVFLAGIFFAMVSVISTYVLAQMSAARHPRLATMGFAFHLSWMVVPAMLSFFAFAVGVILALQGVVTP